jgi:hypothetical protein
VRCFSWEAHNGRDRTKPQEEKDMATMSKPDMTTPFDPAQLMQIEVINADCIRLTHDFGFCHLTPNELMRLIANLGNALAETMKLDAARANAK